MSTRGVRRLLWLLAAATWLTPGCGGTKGPADDTGEDDARVARSVVRRDAIELIVAVEPAEARLSDEPTLTLTIRHKPGVDVRKPPFGESLGDFLIRDFREPLPRAEGGWEVIEQVYTLEPDRTGELTIWPIAVTYVDNRPAGDGEEHTVRTEELTVEVASVIESEAPSLDELRPMAEPVELSEPRGVYAAWWIAMLAAALAASGAAVLLRLLLRRRRPARRRGPTPQEEAWLRLNDLLQKELAKRDVKLFYVELTGIVRRYIERTTGVRAPEQTTEEFLHQISTEAVFIAEESGRLGDFLEAADLVKFAGHRPRREDVEESVRRAKRFMGLAQMEAAA